MMAGLDGVQNKIHPGDAADKNLYDLPPKKMQKSQPFVCHWNKRSSPWTKIANS